MVKCVSFFMVFLFVSMRLSAQEQLHVFTEPNVVVYLNGEIKGFTTLKSGGLHLENVNSGEHVLALYKLNHLVQQDTIYIIAGQENTYYSKAFSTQEGKVNSNILVADDGPKGSLKVQTLPVGVFVEIPLIGVSAKKTEDKFLVSNIGCGTYQMSLVWNGKKVVCDFVIKEGHETHLFVNMLKNLVHDKSKGADPRPKVAKIQSLAQN